MKKIVALLTMLLAFTLSANAQDAKAASAEAAKKDAQSAAEYLGLKANQQEDFYRLFEQKHEVLQNPNMSAERKAEMSRIVGLKIRASLTEAQIAKLDANPELMKKLQQ
ncbi:MAG TPA: hypothetical protein VFQ50_07600 [Flavobacterium sp.]|jgi:ABC-type uncharacterized transport system YnjBCD substrate-binding protein|nr:hypothetical protein [Flavobacterium sp.]